MQASKAADHELRHSLCLMQECWVDLKVTAIMKRQGERKKRIGRRPLGEGGGVVCITEVFCVQERALNKCAAGSGAAHKHPGATWEPCDFHLEVTGTYAQPPPGFHIPATWQLCGQSRPTVSPEQPNWPSTAAVPLHFTAIQMLQKKQEVAGRPRKEKEKQEVTESLASEASMVGPNWCKEGKSH